MRLVGLTNTRRVRRCRFIRCATQGVFYLGRGMAVTAAGDNGAINAWNDRDGKYRVEAMRQRETVDSAIFTNLKAVRSWLAVWLKAIQ